MQFRALGNSSLRVSLVGLGCNNFGGRLDREGSRAVIHAALDAGITLFDTADTYPLGNAGESERVLGEALGARRKDVAIATKFGMGTGAVAGASRRAIVTAVEASLKRLNTDTIDLFQQHCPDSRTPIEESLRALDDLVRAGKVRAIGCSNFSAAQVDEAQAVAARAGLSAFVSCQDEYSLLVRYVEKDLLPAAQKHGMGFLPYFPLANGLLTGKYARGEKPAPDTRLGKVPPLRDRYLTDANLDFVDRLKAFARVRGRTLVELAFSWLASRPQMTSVIAGASTPAQVRVNAAAADWTLSADEFSEIERLRATLPRELGRH